MNAYLVYLPNLDAVAELIAAMKAAELWAQPWMGLLTFAHLAEGAEVVNVVCRDGEQLAQLLVGIAGAQSLHLGTFKEAPCDVTAAA